MEEIIMIELKRFRVTNFRSIMDSGWVECDEVTSLVGINEAGKSNVILALWKLNPVRDGEIDILHDMPTKEFSSWRDTPEKIAFISADFELDKLLVDKVVALCKCDRSVASVVNIQRLYNSEYIVSFPNYQKKESIAVNIIAKIINDAIKMVSELDEKTKSEAGIKSKALNLFESILDYINEKDVLYLTDQAQIAKLYPKDITRAATSDIYPQITNVKDNISKEFSTLNTKNPSCYEDVHNLVLQEMPQFIYYSNYGNLDAQIYLPHAIRWLKGKEVAGINNDAKVRTLRVLFDFVKLDPQEVLDLGKDPVKIVVDQYGTETKRQPSDEEIAKATEQKAARAILLNSASTDLTRKFKEWWKQGNYIFRFQADGEFFKIWVSDDKRPEEIELERRSTGLQWFLSFFLVFLVESQAAHKGAILLLDEAGLSLHPLAQKDLITFFDGLSETNQLIYTTHSPFLVDTSNIDRIKVVYSDDSGQTVVSSDLRAADDKLNLKSIYAVHAALGLSVSDILLQGCQPIIVEGPSDQYYFNAIKLFLIKNKKYIPNMELVFIPSGGVKGVSGVVSIVGGRNGDLPLVILDADGSGKSTKTKLQSGLYQNNVNAIVDIGEFLEFENGEVEDLIPFIFMARHTDKMFRDIEDENFEDAIVEKKPIIPQIEGFANRHNISLPNGWKVDMARSVKQQLLKPNSPVIVDEYLSKWEALFNRFNL